MKSTTVILLLTGALTIMTAAAQNMRPLANDFVTVCESPDSVTVYTYSPGIVRLDSVRLVATLDLGGPGLKDWPAPKCIRYGQPKQGKVFTSDDGGATWTHTPISPLCTPAHLSPAPRYTFSARPKIS